VVISKIRDFLCDKCRKRIEKLEKEARQRISKDVHSKWNEDRPRRIYWIQLPKFLGGNKFLIFDGGYAGGDLHVYEYKYSISKWNGTLHDELYKISKGRHYDFWSITKCHDALIEGGL